MAVVKRFLLFLPLLLHVTYSHEHCTRDDLMLDQTLTGNRVKDKPEFQVQVFNSCPCLQAEVELACQGFRTVAPMDPLVLSKIGGKCLFNNGSAMPPFTGSAFTYAWDNEFPFRPMSSMINCTW